MIEILNAELLDQVRAGQDIKILLSPRKAYFAYLNVQHSEMERSVFGLDGRLEKTIPGYVKGTSRTIELRMTPAFPLEAARELWRALAARGLFTDLPGFRVLYGRTQIDIT